MLFDLECQAQMAAMDRVECPAENAYSSAAHAPATDDVMNTPRGAPMY